MKRLFMTFTSWLYKTSMKRIYRVKMLPFPIWLNILYPLSRRVVESIERSRKEFIEAMKGFTKKIVVVIGPCSIHNYDLAIRIAKWILKLEKLFGDKIIFVMRVYFEKPRTTVGWSGWILDPDLDGTGDVARGLYQAARLLKELREMGVKVETEFLGPLIPPYISRFITGGAIGARTTESHSHRKMASILSMPVGFKNGTDGSITVALDAMESAAEPGIIVGPSPWLGLISKLYGKGNKDTHLILRGGKRNGESISNYDEDSVNEAVRQLEGRGLNSRIMVDCSHDNSGKKARNQMAALKGTISSIKSGKVFAVMIEANETEKSITDECVTLEEGEEMVKLIYDSV